MTAENVMVRVTGIQQLIENADAPADSWRLSEEDRTEIYVPGYCSQKGERCFLLYEETDEEGQTVHTTVKLEGDAFEVSRRGSVVSRLSFSPGGWHESLYTTPFGAIHLGVRTGNVIIRRWKLGPGNQPPCIIAEADYVMEMDHIPTARCRVKIEAGPSAGQQE